MLYTVGEMARLTGIAASTLRYYDKEGLLPFLERSGSGIRMFKDGDYEWLRIIECLKRTGMPLKDIRRFVEMAMQGDETIETRLQMFVRQREAVEQRIEELRGTMEILDYKCWYYQQAKEAGTTAIFQSMTPEQIPEEYRAVKEQLKGSSLLSGQAQKQEKEEFFRDNDMRSETYGIPALGR